MNTDHNLWKVIQNGNNKKSLGRDSKEGIIILPPVSFEEHVAVQRETKARTLLLQSAASGDPTGSLPASRVPAGGVHAASDFVPAVFNNDPAASSPLSLGHSLGSCEHTTRFPSSSDLGNHQPTAGIFSSSSYDDDFCADVTNLALTVVMDPVTTKRVNIIHPQSQIIRDLQSPIQTRGTVQKSKFGESAFISYVHTQNRTNHADYQHCLFACFLSQLEPSSVAKALEDPDWIAIGTKWILKNKRDARGIVVHNKARLVAQGHRQEDGIDYDEVIAPVARIEAIRLFLAFSSYMGFMVYQTDVKSAFLYGEIDEEVYVTQPKGFEDPHNPKHVYRVVKALYGLHQAPRALYARLSTFLLKHNFRKGTIDKTLFLKKDSRHIILVQVYMDDIIFGSTNKAWCDEFEVLMKGEFEMSAMGEVMFFLRLQVKQLPNGIFISQDKYVTDMLKKFDMESVRTETTPYEVLKHRSKDEPDDTVNVHLYRSMIGSFIYLTASMPDIMFAVSACSRHQVTRLTSHLNAVKKIFKYLKGKPNLGLWYPRDSPFQLEAYSNSDYAGSHGDRKSTTGGCSLDPELNGLLLVVLVRADDLVPADGCTLFDGCYEFLQLYWFLLVVLFLVPTVVLVPTGSGTNSAGRYLFLLLDWILLVVVPIPTGSYLFTLINFFLLVVVLFLLVVYTVGLVPTGGYAVPAAYVWFIMDGMLGNVARLFSNMKLNWDGPHMPLLEPMLVVSAGGDAASAAANVAAGPGPSSAPQVLPMRKHTPVREPSTVREPSPVRDPTPVREPSPRLEPPSPSRHPSVPEDIREGGGDIVSSSQSNETPQTLAATAAGGAEDSAALTALSLNLDRCLHRVTTLENELGITKRVLGGAVLKLATRVKLLEGILQQRKQRLVLSDSEGEDATITEQEFDLAALHTLASVTLGDDSSALAAGPDVKTTMPIQSTSTTRRRLKKPFTAHVSETIPAGVCVPTAATTSPAGSSMDAAVHAVAAPCSSIPTADDKGKAPMVDDSLPADLLSEQERVLNNLYDSQLREELAKKIHTEQEAERSTFRPKPTLDAPPAKRANQEAPQVPAVSSQDPAGVPTAPSIPADVSLPAATSSAPIDIPVPAVSIAHAAVSVPIEPMVHPVESHMDDPLTTPKHGSSEPTVATPTPSSSRHRHKHIAKKRVTPIVDMADAAMIKFDSDIDDDPLPYAPYADWEMRLLGAVDALCQTEESDTFALLLWGDLHVLFQSLDDEDALYFWRNQDSWRIRNWRLYPQAQVYVLEMVDGRVIYMFVDVSNPLFVGTLERMLKHRLEESKLLVGGDLTMAEQLIGFIKAALLNVKSAD
nr:putative ribonuclease H-like domain-containing protein [Tanacetum cinerariifolium]